MRTAAIALVPFLLAGLATQSHAQGAGPRHGTQSLTFLGNLTARAADFQSGQLTIQTGYYANDHVEYGYAIGASFISRPGFFQSGGQVGTLVRYHFSGDRVVPYVGLYPNYGFVRGAKGTGILIGAVGADIFIQPQVSLVTEYAVVRSFSSDVSTTSEVNVGIKLFFH